MENKIRKIIKEQIKKLVEMKVTDKDGKDVTSDIIKKIEKSLEKAGYKFTKGYTSDPDLRKDDPRYTKAEGEEEFTPDLEKDDLQRKAIKQMMDKEKRDKEADDAEQDEWDKGWYGESLKSLAEALGYIKEEFTSAEQFFNKMSDEEKKEVTSKWTVDGADENIIKSYNEVLNWLRTYVRPTKDLPSDESQKVLDQTIMDYVKEKQLKEESDDEKSDDEGPDHGKLRTSPSGTKFRVWDKKTDMMGNPRGTKRKDKNMQGGPLKKGNVNYRGEK